MGIERDGEAATLGRQLDFVRRELTELAGARILAPLSAPMRAKYDELCATEVELLRRLRSRRPAS
ncbi:MAG TPA: hypothetical protein VMV02_00090 [Acidimicrobiales bacterium]|nr:hypothetical protein [Acidimicrobiales bacterium]HVC26039.1 hypothetical protein [Acidimicrobiales bacterium]